MKQKTKKPSGQLQQQHPQQHQQQYSPPVSQPWQQQQQQQQQPLPSSYFTLGSPPPPAAVQQSSSSTSQSYTQGFANLRPVSPSYQLVQTPIGVTTSTHHPTAYTAPGTTAAAAAAAAAAGRVYADPRMVSPRGVSSHALPAGSSSSSGSSDLAAASSSTAAMGVTSPGRTVSGGLAARIQAAELAASGTFDPASWAAAAAEAVRADKEAAAAAARQAKQQEDAQRRLQQQQAAAAALAAGRVSSAVASRQPSEPGYTEPYMSAAHTPRDWQQQQQQEQPMQFSGTGWLTSSSSTKSSPAAGSTASAAAAAAAALAAATAGYPRASSPFKDPAQIAAEYVELQRQQQQQQQQDPNFAWSSSATGSVQLSPRMQGYGEMHSSLREQYTASSTSTMQQQRSQSLTPMSHQSPMVTWQDPGFSHDTVRSPSGFSHDVTVTNVRSPSGVPPQLAPIRTVLLTQPEAVQSGPAVLPVSLAVQEAVQQPGQYSGLSVTPAEQQMVVQQQYQPRHSPQAVQGDQQHMTAAAAAAAATARATMRFPVCYSPGSSSPAVAAAGSTVTAGDVESTITSTQDGGSSGRPLAATKHSSTAAAAAAQVASSNKKATSRCSWLKQRKVLCVLVPLLAVAAAAVAIGLGVGLSRGRQQPAAAAAAAAAAPDRLYFVVTAAVPTSQPAVSCAKWFGSDKALETYRATVVSSYAAALSIPPADFHISSIQCGGTMMTNPAEGLSSPARHLLAAAAAAAAAGRSQQQQSRTEGSSSITTDVVTTFSVPNPHSESESSRIINAVEANSEDLLSRNLNRFFSEPVTIRSAINVRSESAARSLPAAAQPDEPQPTIPPPPPPGSESPAKAATTAAAAPPPPPQRVAVPAPAVPAGVPVLLPLHDARPQQGAEQQNPPLYEPYNRQTSTKQPAAAPATPRSNVLDNTIPNCSTAPTVGNSVIDSTGNLWGWENWRSCVFRGYTSVQPERVGSAWEQAPACTTSPDNMNSVLDSNGMRWGWENSRSCAFRPEGWVLWVQQPQPVWDTAPTCAFAADNNNSVTDSNGNLWGWQNSQSCAFRGRYIGAAQQGAVRWESAPSCDFAPTLVNSVTAVDGKLWGWQDGRSCAFRPSEN